MNIFGKDEQKRLDDTFAYIHGLGVVAKQVEALERFVYANSIWTAGTISNALSLGSRPLIGGSSTNQRHAVRACMLAKLAAEQPRAIDETDKWRVALEKLSKADLDVQIKAFLQRLVPPATLPVVASGAEIQAAYRKLAKTPKPAAKLPPPPPAVSFDSKIAKFEKESRQHVILSGHGSLQPRNGGWPSVALKHHQRICFYVPDYWPLGNDVGKLVDNRQFPRATEEIVGPATIWDYLLHHKDKLVLLNSPVGDALFINVQTDTPLSTFVNDPKFAAVTFHWAACRVCMAADGKVLNPLTNTFELYDATHTPYVLNHAPPVV